jgi:hypothetical protein
MLFQALKMRQGKPGLFAFLWKSTLCRDGENKPEKFDTDNGGFIMIHTDKP